MPNTVLLGLSGASEALVIVLINRNRQDKADQHTKQWFGFGLGRARAGGDWPSQSVQ